MKEKVLRAFVERFGGEAEFLVRAPGRVNLIGEHTDYNDGYVMPAAIERATWLALRRRNDENVSLHSIDFGETDEFQLKQVERSDPDSWKQYLRGVAWAISSRYPQFYGWEGVVCSDLPIGTGLSSSASFELAVAGAFSAAAGLEWDARRMAMVCHKAEVEWVGMNCGMMDHLASAEGKAGHALLIDCRSLESQAVPLPAGVALVILDTRKPRGLVGSAYNDRRAECEAAAEVLGVASLRDASLEMVEAARSQMNPVLFQRARHVISENDRTLRAARAMRENDLTLLGRLMAESHESLRVDFEVSCPELDTMVACAQAAPGCLGARMTGAGFGGCAVALVDEGTVETFMNEVSRGYLAVTGIESNLFASFAADGASCTGLVSQAAQS